MGNVPKIVCINCGKEIRGINAAKNDGWLIEGDKIYCCCVCKSEFNKKKVKKK